jgi:hypothetical protein
VSGRERAAVVRAVEALEDGEPDYGLKILRDLLDEHERLLRCPCCGQRFQWPGELDGHLARGCYCEEAA